MTSLFRRMLARPNAQPGRRSHGVASKARLLLQALETRETPAIFTVTTTNDTGAGSLREAIILANSAAGADTIDFNLTAGPKTITLSTALSQITSPVTITNSTGAENLTITRKFTAPVNFGILSFSAAGADSVINGLTITGGNAGAGGAITNSTGNLTITDSIITGNTGTKAGGVYLPSGFSKQLTIQNTTISGNTGLTGGVYFASGGSLLIQNSTIVGNTGISTLANHGGGLAFNGTVGATGFAVESSTIVDNSTVGTGGGGGVNFRNVAGVVSIRNSTITGNSAPSSALGGGGVGASGGNPTISVNSSVIAQNKGPIDGPDLRVANGTASGNNNFVGVDPPANFIGTGNLTGTVATPLDPLLGVLRSNGGLTQTRAPLPGSPLLETGSNPAALAFDQRGAGFPRQLGTQVDIGAVEGTISNPTGVATVPDVTVAGGTSATITVTYAAVSPAQINVATIGAGDLTITGPNGFIATPTFVSATPNANSATITATYTFTPPGGAWDILDDGQYPIRIGNGQVQDTNGLNVIAGVIGTLNVAIPTNYVVTNLNDSGVGSLRAIMNQSNGDVGPGIITFLPGLTGAINLTTGEIPVTDSVSIVGPGDAVVSINGALLPSATNRLFNVNGAGTLNVAFSGVTLAGGNINAGNGGAVLNADENLTFANVTISGNTTSAGQGGGVFSSSGKVTITDSKLINNSAPNQTGTNGIGGAVLSGGALTVVNTAVTGNTAGQVGAGLAVANANMTVQGSTVTGNTAKESGGGLAVYGSGVLDVSNSTISSNTASTAQGGAVFQQFGTATIANTTIDSNTSSAEGGGIFIGTNVSLTLTGSKVTGNRSNNSDGGGIDASSTNTVNLTDTIVSGNKASGGGGGGIYFGINGVLNATNSTISGNTASTIGGGVAFSNGGSLNLVGSTVSGNLASGAAANGVGGGIYFRGTVGAGGFTVSNSTISSNSAPGGSGGGIALVTHSSSAAIRNSTVALNSTGGKGGGISRSGGTGTVDLTSTVLALNTGTNPDLFVSDNTVNAANSLIGIVPLATSVVGPNNKLGVPATPLDPLLGPLQDNGGTNLTHAPLAGSPLIDNGVNPAPVLVQDQRNLVRDYGPATDIGAVETQPPKLVGIVAPLGPTNAATVTFTVSFNQPVTVLPVTAFVPIATGSIVGASVASTTSTGTGKVWTVTVNTGTGDGDLSLQFANTTGVVPVPDPVGIPLTSAAVAIDKVLPAVSSVARLDAQEVAGATARYTVTFTEPVSTLAASNLALATTGDASGSIGLITGSGLTWTVNITGIVGNGDLRLDLVNSTGILDTSGNPVSNAPFQGEVYYIGAPIVTSLTTAAVSPTNSPTVTYTLTFNRPLASGPTGPNFFVATSPGITGTSVSVAPVSSSVYTITVNTGTGDGSLQLVLQTSAGIIPTPAFLPYAGPIIAIDKSQPTPTAITQLDSPTTFSSLVRYALTFSEPVSTLKTSNLTLTSTGLTGSAITGISGVGVNYTVTVNAGTGATGTLQLALTNSTTLTDQAGNVVAGLPVTGGVYTVDRTVPGIATFTQLDPVLTNLSTVRYQVTFTEPVTGLTTANFSLTTTGLTGAGNLTLSGSGANYLLTMGTGTGSGSLRLDLSNRAGVFDSAGNQLSGTANGPVYTLDRVSPTATAVNRIDSPFSNSETVRYAVAFSKPVVGLTASNFSVLSSGLTGASIGAITGTGANYTVILNTGAGSGLLGLALSNSAGLADATGNAVLGVPLVGSQYTIDRVAPAAVIVPAAGQPNPTVDNAVTFTVTFNEPVTGFGPSGVTLGGSVAASIQSVTGSGTTYTVSVLRLSGTGDVTASVNAGSAVDSAGNANVASGQASVTFDLGPTGLGDLYSVKYGKVLAVPTAQSVLNNDKDPEGQTLQAVLLTPPPATAGKLTLNADGSFTFAPFAGFSGTTSFTYAATDGRTQSAPITVVIDVAAKVSLTAVAADAGGGPMVIVYNADGTTRFAFFAYAESFTGGVRVTTGDVTGDGVDDIITVAGAGGGPHITAFDGTNGRNLFSFYAYEETFTGGLYIAAGDVNGDGIADIITGTGAGGGPRVRAFNGKDHSVLKDFFAYSSDFRGGVLIGAGDVDGDGLADIVTGAGPGAGPHVKAFRGTDLTILQSFFAFNQNFTGGVNVAVGVGQDGLPVIVAGSAVGTSVRVFGGKGGMKQIGALDFASDSPGTGVRLATKDTDGDGKSDTLFMAPGKGELPRVRRLELPGLVSVGQLAGFPSDFLGGLFVG